MRHQLVHRSAARSVTALLAIALVPALACNARKVQQAGLPVCTRCHGDPADTSRAGLALSAPPRSTAGDTSPGSRRVGAHLQHLVAGPIRAAIECRECHVVPDRIEGHPSGGNGGSATVTFGGALGRAQLPAGVQPSYDPGAPGGPRCSSVYCHGATMTGGTNTQPVWTTVDGTQRSCTSCHGYPPAWHVAAFPAADSGNCHLCHGGTVLADNATIDVAGGLHVDGVKQAIAIPGSCRGCHARFPPADAIHAVHSSPPSSIAGISYGDLHSGAGATAEAYDFGCGECHPTVESAHFARAAASGPDVDLLPPATPVPGDDIKRRNAPGAAYDPVSGTCRGVYCHSSGQETPTYVTTPNWRSPPAAGLGCDGCHGNPPKYASGGAGAATANSHVFFDADGWESGHFAGLPGPGHNSKHGGGNQVFAVASGATGTWGPGQAASPITCQACHFDTVDRANVIAGRFFYLDTPGVATDAYRLAGGNLSRFDTTPPVGTKRSSFDEWRGNQCGHCHDGRIAPAGAGKALPAKHVDGRRDVVFDARTAYAGSAVGLPALPAGTVLRPYYMTDSFNPLQPAEIHADARIVASTPQVLSMHLGSARWDAATRTCSDVACHMLRQQKVAAGLEPPLRWGGQLPYPPPAETGSLPCTGCHDK